MKVSSVTEPTIMVGCDPEFGLFDKETNRLVSAHGLLPGTKAKPHVVPRGAIQVDGMMVEFNIDPCKTGSEFASNVDHVLSKIKEYLPTTRYDYIYNPSIFFDPGYIKELPTEATELGCSPDYNAWHDGGVNPRPSPPSSVPGMRSCGGHIHISWTKDADVTDLSHRWDCCAIVRVLDCYVLPLLERIEPDNFRRELYGKPGAFRPKPYGVEWRTPSNTWLQSKSLQSWMIDFIIALVKATLKGTITVPNKHESKWSPDRITRIPFYYGTSEYCPATYFNSEISNLVATQSKSSVVTGIRVASTSGKVNFDLNLDVVPVGGANLNYTNPNAVDSSLLNPVIK